MKKIIHSRSFKITAILMALCFAVLSFYHFNYTPPAIQIKKFDKARDTQFILDCFKNDRYWLTNNPDFSEQFMIDYMTPKQEDPAFYGKQNIVIIFDQGVPAGFGAYYMKNFYEGTVHFLCVDKAHRGKGLAAKLMSYMMSQLTKMGSKYLKLVTRVNNAPARALYKKLGFSESAPDEQGFIHLEQRK